MSHPDEGRPGPAREPGYDGLSRWLHWITAVLVLALWLIGLAIESFPRGWLRNSVRSIHIVMGFALLALWVLRITWRFTAARHPERSDQGRLDRLARHAHWILLGWLGLTLLAGVLDAWVRGVPVFGWWTFTSPAPGVRWIRKAVGGMHEWLGHGLIVLASLHALAALWHHWVLRDGVLRSMLPARSGTSRKPPSAPVPGRCL